MTHKNGFMSDLSSEAQSRRSAMASRHRDSETQRKNSATSPWRKGPVLNTRKAHEEFAKRVAGPGRSVRQDK